MGRPTPLCGLAQTGAGWRSDPGSCGKASHAYLGHVLIPPIPRDQNDTHPKCPLPRGPMPLEGFVGGSISCRCVRAGSARLRTLWSHNTSNYRRCVSRLSRWRRPEIPETCLRKVAPVRREATMRQFAAQDPEACLWRGPVRPEAKMRQLRQRATEGIVVPRGDPKRHHRGPIPEQTPRKTTPPRGIISTPGVDVIVVW